MPNNKTSNKKKYFIKTFGCQMNFSDSERISAILEEYELAPANKITEADFVIFNTCGVRETAENRVFGQVHNLRKKNQNCTIVVTGCLSEKKDVQKKLKGKVDFFLPIKKITYLPELLIGKQRKKALEDYLKITPKYEKKSSAFVPIMTGCNNFCSYCVVPYTRGREKSRPIGQIFKEIEKLCQQGKCKHVVLLGQNVNSYTHEIKDAKKEMANFTEDLSNKITFPFLLEFLATNFPSIEFTFLTSHPKDFSDELISVIARNDNINRKIHLPVQSGSDKILKAMNRPYTQEHYLQLVDKIKKTVPKARLSTDVIVGFPGETEKDFLETIKVFRKAHFCEAFLNKYSPRPETKAFPMGDPIPWQEKKRRERVLKKFICTA